MDVTFKMYSSQRDLLVDDPFYRKLEEVAALHAKKSNDYSSATDPLANIRASEEFGVPAWLGAMIRLNDKITRIKSYTRNGKLSNESVRDSLIDLAVYAIIALTLWDEHETTTPV